MRGGDVSAVSRLTNSEAIAMTIMAEYMSNTRDDVDVSSFAEQLMACVESCEAKSGAGADMLKAIRADASRDTKYDAGAYLGLGDSDSMVTSNMYQFCVNYPSWTYVA